MIDKLVNGGGAKKVKQVKKIAKQTGREVDREKRSINRDVRDYERQEKKLLTEIKAASKKGDERQLKQLAKQLVRVRKGKEKIQGAAYQLDDVKMTTKAMAANVVVADSMVKATKAVKKINNIAKPESVMKTMQEYQMEMEKSKIKEEVMDDALAAAFDTEGAEEMEDEIVNQVLEEAGVNLLGEMDAVPLNTPGVKMQEQEAESEGEEAVEL